MPTKTTFGVFIFAALTLLFFNSGCSGKNTEAFGEFTMPSQKPPAQPTPPAEPDPAGDPNFNAKNFYVGLSPTDTTIAYVHKTTGFADRCTIPVDTTSSQDVTCLVEIPEGELFNLGLNLMFNVPRNFCAYLRRDTYWYYNNDVGVGPTAINIATDIDPGGVVSHTCSVNGTPLPSCSSDPEITITFNPDNNTASTTCRYACCFGNYTFEQVITDQVNGTTTTNFSDNSWGNSVSACLGGAARTSWSEYSGGGFPAGLISPSLTGLNSSYAITAPINLGAPLSVASNRSVANFYTPVSHTHTGFLTPATTSTRPYFMDPIDDLSGSNLRSSLPVANDAYTFGCYDTGFELIHRIRVYVREWDTRAEYIRYISSEGVNGNPNSAVVDCNNFSDGSMLDNCNDFTDLDNFLDTPAVGGSYDTSPGNVSNRRNYFPRDFYP